MSTWVLGSLSSPSWTLQLTSAPPSKDPLPPGRVGRFAEIQSDLSVPPLVLRRGLVLPQQLLCFWHSEVCCGLCYRPSCSDMMSPLMFVIRLSVLCLASRVTAHTCLNGEAGGSVNLRTVALLAFTVVLVASAGLT